MVHMLVKSPRAAVCVTKSTNSCHCFSRKGALRIIMLCSKMLTSLNNCGKKRKKRVVGVGAVPYEAAGGQCRMKSLQQAAEVEMDDIC